MSADDPRLAGFFDRLLGMQPRAALSAEYVEGWKAAVPHLDPGVAPLKRPRRPRRLPTTDGAP